MSDFTLDDFKSQIERVLNPGLLERMARIMMTREMREILADEELRRDACRIIGIIEAMTPVERLDPKAIDSSRANRIARGAGVSPDEVFAVLKQHDTMAPVIRAMSAKSKVQLIIRPLPKWWSKRFGRGDT